MNPCIQIQFENQWKKGHYENILVMNEGISLDFNQAKKGLYIGAVIDSNQINHEWYRMQFETVKGVETKIILNTLITNNLDFENENIIYDIKQLIDEKIVPPKDIIKYLERFNFQTHEDTTNILLNSESGRYLIYWFEIHAEFKSDTIKSLRIYYEKVTWLSYLPQIYSDDKAFLEKYLTVFQTVFEDFEGVIDKLPMIYMPEKTVGNFLEVLNRWMPIEGFDYWNEEQRRRILSHYNRINKLRGTKAGVSEYVELFLGEAPFLIEPSDYKYLSDSLYHKKLYSTLYSSHPFGFTILVSSGLMKSRKEIQALENIINQCIPAQVSYKMTVLNPYMRLDDYTYLGINSYVYNPVEIKLDDKSMISMGIIDED